MSFSLTISSLYPNDAAQLDGPEMNKQFAKWLTSSPKGFSLHMVLGDMAEHYFLSKSEGGGGGWGKSK
jgi:hypothetical protein